MLISMLSRNSNTVMQKILLDAYIITYKNTKPNEHQPAHWGYTNTFLSFITYSYYTMSKSLIQNNFLKIIIQYQNLLDTFFIKKMLIDYL